MLHTAIDSLYLALEPVRSPLATHSRTGIGRHPSSTPFIQALFGNNRLVLATVGSASAHAALLVHGVEPAKGRVGGE